MEARCELCKRLLFKFIAGAVIYGEIHVQCSRKDCRYINVLKGELKDDTRTVSLDNPY